MQNNRLLQQFWRTKENAGSQQAHVRGAEEQIAARCRQEKWHAEDLHGVAGIGPTAHEQKQPVEQAKTSGRKKKPSVKQRAPASVCSDRMASVAIHLLFIQTLR